MKTILQALEAQLEDAGKVKEELARVQQQLGALHGTASALRSQLKAAKEQRDEAASVRERMLSAQVGGWVGERVCGGWLVQKQEEAGRWAGGQIGGRAGRQ